MPTIRPELLNDKALVPSGFNAGDTIKVTEGEMLPQAPPGLAWILTTTFATVPASYEYALATSPQRPQHSATKPVQAIDRARAQVTDSMASEVSPAREPRLVVRGAQWGDVTAARQGASLPAAPRGMRWQKTGRELATSPPQFEYRLEKKSGPSFMQAAKDALTTVVAEIQGRVTEEIRDEDAVSKIDLHPLTGEIVVELDERRGQAASALAGMQAVMEKHLEKAGFKSAKVSVELVSATGASSPIRISFGGRLFNGAPVVFPPGYADRAKVALRDCAYPGVIAGLIANGWQLAIRMTPYGYLPEVAVDERKKLISLQPCETYGFTQTPEEAVADLLAAVVNLGLHESPTPKKLISDRREFQLVFNRRKGLWRAIDGVAYRLVTRPIHVSSGLEPRGQIQLEDALSACFVGRAEGLWGAEIDEFARRLLLPYKAAP